MSFEPTQQQRKAIEAPLGPVLVIAGPGAGKTFCLIYRIQHLIQKLEIQPRRILALTFTNKAAEEIATRLHETRGVAAAEVTRGTLHATCLMILRDFAERCGLRPGFGVADREYQEQVLRRLRIPAKRCPQALALFSLYRLRGKPLSERGLAFFGQYRDALRSRNLADFDDLITLTEELLRTDAAAARELRSRWDYVLVDEFQDLNPAQYGIVRRLADTHRCLFGVGDDEQSIFSWTGADPAIISQFRDDFGSEPVVLDENRRCSIQILDSARRLIACNPVLFQKQIDTHLESPFGVVAHGFENEDLEASWLIADILRDRAAAETGWGQYAVLYRYRWMGRDLEQRLIRAGIPCRLARGQALADDKVVGWVIASLRVIRCPEDPVLVGALADLALPPALRQEIRKISSKEKGFLANLRAFASQRPKGDSDRRRAWRLLYHIENLRGMARSHGTLSGLVDELLARPIGAGRNPLEEHHHELTEPSLYPGAAMLARRLEQCKATETQVRVETGGGLEIPLLAMLRGAGLTNAHPIGADELPSPGEFVIRRGQADGWPLRLFKALQIVQTSHMKADFDDFVAFDVETSDFNFEACEIVEIAAVRVRGNAVVDWFHTLVACSRPISAEATDVHGYRDQDLIGAPPMEEVWRRFREFVAADIVVAHNGQEFDVPVLRRACGGFPGFDELVFYDTLPLARAVVEGSVKLTHLAQKFNVEVGRAHHAMDDATMLAAVVPALNELRVRRARKIALAHLLDQLGLALALDQQSSGPEESLLRDITRPYTLGRYSDCLDAYASQVAAGAPDAPPLDDVIAKLGGYGLMERLRAERPVDERYPDSVDRLRTLVQASRGDSVAEHTDDMLCRVALSSSADVETDPNRVNLLTLHSTKGLEFSRVYILGVENQILPGWRAIQENRIEEIREGRRLLYVGMTRAKHRLVLTHVERRAGFGAQGSLFLTEAGLVLEDPGIPPALEVPAISE